MGGVGSPNGKGWNREIHCALTGASWRRVRSWTAERKFPHRSGSYVVTKATWTPAFGRSTHSSAYLTHIVDEVLIAWRWYVVDGKTSGRIVGYKARWRCGSGTSHFRLLDEPDSVVCPACTIERVPREKRKS